MDDDLGGPGFVYDTAGLGAFLRRIGPPQECSFCAGSMSRYRRTGGDPLVALRLQLGFLKTCRRQHRRSQHVYWESKNFRFLKGSRFSAELRLFLLDRKSTRLNSSHTVI